MDFLKIILVSVFSLVVLFLLTKMLGYKQLSQMNMFDYINGITVGSIAAEMATSLEGDFWQPLTAMIVYTGLAYLISIAANKSLKLRRFFNGKSIVLLDNGKLFKKNFAKAHIDINEFLLLCRVKGYYNLDDVQTVIIEPNGQLSILPKAEKRPVYPNDLGLKPETEKPIVNVILDGKVLDGNLNYTGNNREWLKKQLGKLGITNEKKVFLAFVDNNNKLSAYLRLEEKPDRDLFL